jgi:hypothetical protein
VVWLRFCGLAGFPFWIIGQGLQVDIGVNCSGVNIFLQPGTKWFATTT